MKQELEKTEQTMCHAQEHEHCLTCGDIALSVCVVRVDEANQTAFVQGESLSAEVDISLVPGVLPGDKLLVHGGVAIAVEPPGNTS